MDTLPTDPCPRCAELEARISLLAAKVAELEARLSKNSSNSSKPPSSDLPWSGRSRKRPKSKKKQGGQPGHERHERALVPESELSSPPVDVKPAICPCCGEPLSGDDPAPIRHQIFELPIVKPIVTEHRQHALSCAKCGTRSRAKLPDGVPAGHFGPRAVATMATLTGALHLSRRTACRAMNSLFGTKVSLGMTTKLEARAARALEEPCAKVEAAVAKASVRHADESPWPHGRRADDNSRKALSWLWTVVSECGTTFRILPGRGKAQAQQMLLIGEDGAALGTIVSDRLASYNCVPAAQRQICLAHLSRDFDAMAAMRGAQGHVGKALVAAKNRMFAMRDQRALLSAETFAELLASERAHLLAILGTCLGTKKAGMAKNLLSLEPALWNHLLADGVEATNNAAERALRIPVLWRKRSFGTMSEGGARFAERMLTASATLRPQGRELLDTLARALAGHHVSLLRSRAPTGP